MRLAGELEPDVVLLDLSMPVVDGFEASRSAPAPARVVVLTGSSYAEDVEKAHSAGASGYVTKDRIAQHLVRTVLDAVDRRPLAILRPCSTSSCQSSRFSSRRSCHARAHALRP